MSDAPARTIKKAAIEAFEQLEQGANRNVLLQDLLAKYGQEGVFAFAQTEYYRKRQRREPRNAA